MSCLSENHRAKAGVDGNCSVPMWCGGCPSGFCDRPAYGEQFEPGTPWAPQWWSPRDRYGHWLDPYRLPPHCSGLACEQHGGPSETQTRFVRDGNMWCAFDPDFENLQESVAGFGPTQVAAKLSLIAAQGMSAGTAKTEGLGATPASPTPQGDAPDHTPYRSETNAE